MDNNLSQVVLPHRINYSGNNSSNPVFFYSSNPQAPDTLVLGSDGNTILELCKEQLNLPDITDFDNLIKQYIDTSVAIISRFLNRPLSHAQEVFSIEYEKYEGNKIWYKVPVLLAQENTENGYTWRKSENGLEFMPPQGWDGTIEITTTLVMETGNTGFASYPQIKPLIQGIITLVAEMFRSREATIPAARMLNNVVIAGIAPYQVSGWGFDD